MTAKTLQKAILTPFLLMAALIHAQSQDTSQTLTIPQNIPDTLLFKIQKAQSVITEIKATQKKGYGITRIRAGLESVKQSVTPIAADIKSGKAVIDSKMSGNYSIILNDAQTKLTTWRSTLSKSTNELQTLLDQVITLSSDSLLAVSTNDTTGRKFYADQLVTLKFQLQDAGKRTTARLDTVSRLLADVSGISLTINELQAAINEQIQKSAVNAFQKESPYLWEAPVSLSLSGLLNTLSVSLQGQTRLFGYFFRSSWDNLFVLVILSGLFFLWVLNNYKKANRPVLRQKIEALHLVNLNPVPVVASLIVLLILTPLFEPQSPSVYIEISQFLLFLTLTIHLWHRFSENDARMWLMAGVFFVLLILANMVVRHSLFMRLGLITLNAGFLYPGLTLAKRLPRHQRLNRLMRLVTGMYLLFHVLAILLNCFGRVSLAKTLSITAVAGMVQLIGSGIFVELVLEALALQITISTHAQGLFSRVNVNHIQRSFKKGLTFMVVTLWLIAFFINLGLADSLFSLAHSLLTKPRNLGSITFTLSNVFSFTAVIYLSSLLQKNIGLLFGESQLPSVNDKVEPLSSLLALVRLVIIIAGVLFAIAVSGISIDKFTVVLGALSVGIGLGMQNIVSNFVSGIILIFEKPFRIGDYVELADKKGQIREIGIRSSKMLTAQGSEVIIPNGDFIANRIVNWTSSETYLKTELTLKVSSSTDMQVIRELLKQEAGKLNGALHNRSPELFITAIGPDAVDLRIQIWINSIYNETALKSQLLEQLLIACKEAGVQLM